MRILYVHSYYGTAPAGFVGDERVKIVRECDLVV